MGGGGLVVVEGVGHGPTRGLLHDQVEGGLRQSELWSGEYQRRHRDEGRAVDGLLGVRSGVPAFRGVRRRQVAVAGDEDLFGDEGVGRGAAHAGHEPGVLDGQVRHRNEDHSRRAVRAGLVGHADDRPLSVGRARCRAPAAGDGEAAVDRAGGSGGREDTRDAGGRVVRPDIVLGLTREQSDIPGTNIKQCRRPRRRPAGARDLPGHLEAGTHVGLQTAVAGRLQDGQQPGPGESLDVLLHHPPFAIGALGVTGQQREQLRGAPHQFGAQLPVGGGGSRSVECDRHRSSSFSGLCRAAGGIRQHQCGCTFQRTTSAADPA